MWSNPITWLLRIQARTITNDGCAYKEALGVVQSDHLASEDPRPGVDDLKPFSKILKGLNTALKMMQDEGVAAAIEHGLQKPPEDVDMNSNNDDA